VIGARGAYIAPGTFKVTLDVDGDTTSRSFEVRADPGGTVTVAQHKAREAFLVDVMELSGKVEKLVTDLRAKRTAASGEEATKLQALERRLSGGRDAPRGKLGGLLRAFSGSGAQQGSLAAPTGAQRQILAEAKAEIAAIQKEAGLPAK
jgi:hypothetical protein